MLLAGRSASADPYTLTTIASFSGTNGQGPVAGLILDSQGNLYGTTQNGGANHNGTVFEIANGSNSISTIASFNGTNGALPDGGLILDSQGNLYGTTYGGGAGGNGTVFEIANGSNSISTIASFNGTNGQGLLAGLIMDSQGNLYGTTVSGGADHNGTVFEIVNGSNSISTIASFNFGNGALPYGGLILDSQGNLYGTTYGGGPNNYGTVFEIANGSNSISTIASFNGTNGKNPYAGLITDSQGNLYGTTFGGGAGGNGTVFEIANGSNSLSTIASFNGTNGASPSGGLILDSQGNLYGTTYGGGADGNGTVFEIANGSNSLSTIASFNGTNGKNPYAGLIMDSQGNLYGTTRNGGANGAGTVFELLPNPRA